MSRKRLRPAHSPAAIAQLYQKPHRHDLWADHRLRVAVTAELARWMVTELKPARAQTAADLSCGDGAILDQVPAVRRYYGDLAPGYEFQGPIEETIGRLPPVDLFICTETLEHLDDPDDVLARIRGKAHRLIVSTPIEAWHDENVQHYWAWSADDVTAMLQDAGWTVAIYTELDLRPMGQVYAYGIWGVQ